MAGRCRGWMIRSAATTCLPCSSAERSNLRGLFHRSATPHEGLSLVLGRVPAVLRVALPCILYFGTRGRWRWLIAVHRGWHCCWHRRSLHGSLCCSRSCIPLLGPPRALHRVRSILADGEPRDALIEHAEQTGVQVRGFAQWKLQLSFKNLSGTPIRELLLVVDSKPQLQRFGVGRHVDARLSRVPGAFPNVVLDGAQPELNVASLWRRGIGAALGIAAVAAAYVLAYRLQNEGLGWTFLSFGHPLLVCPLVCVAMRWDCACSVACCTPMPAETR